MIFKNVYMNFEEMVFCQSCAMPMGEDDFGTEKDGSKCQDYCNTVIRMVNLQTIVQWKR